MATQKPSLLLFSLVCACCLQGKAAETKGMTSQTPSNVTGKGKEVKVKCTGSDSTQETLPISCAQCLDDGNEVEAAGFCNDCQVYLCDVCIQEHRKNYASKHHNIIHNSLNCAECIEKDVSVIASGYCSECHDYLCQRCVTVHKTYRGTRHHVMLEGESMPTATATSSSQTRSSLPTAAMTTSQKGNVSIVTKPNNSISTSAAPLETTKLPLKKFKPAQKIETHNIKSKEDADDCWVYSFLILPSRKYVLADSGKNNNIKLLDEKFQVCSVLKFTNYSPCDMCLSNVKESEIYVTFPDEASIHCISTAPALCKERRITIQGRCNGIACWKFGIAVTTRTKDKMKYELQLLDHDGMVMKSIDTGTTPQLKFGSPFYLASIMDGQVVIISDYRDGQVTAVDTETHDVMFVYSDKNLVGSHSVTTDSKDNIYVAGWKSNNVHVISATGQSLGVILSERDGLYFPKGVCFDRQNNTLILQPNYEINEVTVYKVYNE